MNRRLLASCIAFTAFLGIASASAQESPDDGEPRPGLQDTGTLPHLFTVPDEHLFELGAIVGAQSWETPFGSRDPNFTVGLTFSALPTPWLRPLVAVDYSRRAESTSSLEVSNSNTFLGGGLGVGAWIGVLRLDLEVRGGALLRTSAHDDGHGNSFSNSRFEFAWDIAGGPGLAFFGNTSLSFKPGVRFFGDRMNVLLLFELAWLVGA